MKRGRRIGLATLSLVLLTGAATERFGPDDIPRLASVAEPAFSPGAVR